MRSTIEKRGTQAVIMDARRCQRMRRPMETFDVEEVGIILDLSWTYLKVCSSEARTTVSQTP